MWVILLSLVGTVLGTFAITPDTTEDEIVDLASMIPLIYWPSKKYSCIAERNVHDCIDLIYAFADEGITAANDVREMNAELTIVRFHMGHSILVNRIFQDGQSPRIDSVAALAEMTHASGGDSLPTSLEGEIEHLNTRGTLLSYLGVIWSNRDVARRAGFWPVFFCGLPSRLRDAFLTVSLTITVSEICQSPNIAAALAETSHAASHAVAVAACRGSSEALVLLSGGDPKQMTTSSLRSAVWSAIARPTAPWLDLPSAVAAYPVEMDSESKCRCVRHFTVEHCLALLVDFIEIFGEIADEDKINVDAVIHIFGRIRNLVNVDGARVFIRGLTRKDADDIYLASRQIGFIHATQVSWKCKRADGKNMLATESRKTEPFHHVFAVINKIADRTTFWTSHFRRPRKIKEAFMSILDDESYKALRPRLAGVCAEPDIVALLIAVKPETHPEKQRMLRLCRELPISSTEFYSLLSSDQEQLIRVSQSSRSKASLQSSLRTVIKAALTHKYIKPCRIQTTCPICADDENLRYAAVTECGHSFCGKCFYEWFRRSKSCPVCREDLVETSESATDFAAISP